jgi:NAD(P)-dependent dehydrogenase (short-subunit alcohol dehydrogenase family)
MQPPLLAGAKVEENKDTYYCVMTDQRVSVAAVETLAGGKHAAAFHPVDVTDDKSIAGVRDFLQARYGRLDVLINNAGIIAKGEAPALKIAQ